MSLTGLSNPTNMLQPRNPSGPLPVVTSIQSSTKLTCTRPPHSQLDVPTSA